MGWVVVVVVVLVRLDLSREGYLAWYHEGNTARGASIIHNHTVL